MPTKYVRPSSDSNVRHAVAGFVRQRYGAQVRDDEPILVDAPRADRVNFARDLSGFVRVTFGVGVAADELAEDTHAGSIESVAELVVSRL